MQDPHAPTPYLGPERRRGAGHLPRLLSALLDEVDHGMLVLRADGRVLHLNHVARDDLARPGYPLAWLDQRLVAVPPDLARPLRQAIDEACHRDRRSLLHLPHGNEDLSVGVMPLPAPPGLGGTLALVKLGRHTLAGELAVHAYSRANGLSYREQEVLQKLCEGLRPNAIATALDISVATVRTHVHNLRRKAGAPDVNTLIRQVARLPPILPAIKRGAGSDPDPMMA